MKDLKWSFSLCPERWHLGVFEFLVFHSQNCDIRLLKAACTSWLTDLRRCVISIFIFADGLWCCCSFRLPVYSRRTFSFACVDVYMHPLPLLNEMFSQTYLDLLSVMYADKRKLWNALYLFSMLSIKGSCVFPPFSACSLKLIQTHEIYIFCTAYVFSEFVTWRSCDCGFRKTFPFFESAVCFHQQRMCLWGGG